MLILVFHPALAKNIMLTCLKFLVKLHIMKDKPERMEKLSSSMDMYNATAAYLKKHPAMFDKWKGDYEYCRTHKIVI